MALIFAALEGNACFLCGYSLAYTSKRIKKNTKSKNKMKFIWLFQIWQRWMELRFWNPLATTPRAFLGNVCLGTDHTMYFNFSSEHPGFSCPSTHCGHRGLRLYPSSEAWHQLFPSLRTSSSGTCNSRLLLVFQIPV